MPKQSTVMLCVGVLRQVRKITWCIVFAKELLTLT